MTFVRQTKFFTILLLPVLFIGLLFMSENAWAFASGKISGKVIDNRTGEGLAGANVILKGTTIGAAADADGEFTINDIPPGSYTVVASFIGYHTEGSEVSVVVDEVANTNFSLHEDVFKGDEVMVTGIASKTSKAIAEVSVSKIKASDYTVTNTYQSTQQLINGKIAGVTVRSSSGNAGSGFRFNVRSGGGLNGNEQPVIYLDGVRIENAQAGGFGVGGQQTGLLADLNPEDIENIEILKGPAAAASYGTNGSNGVVLITTKKGRLTAGTAKGVTLNYKVVRGWNSQSYDYKPSNFVTAKDANRILRTGSIVQNSISASGGSNTLRYFTSFDSRIEDSITRNNSLNRKTIRANLDVIPNNQLTFRINANYTYNNIKRPQNDNNILGYLGNTLLFSFPYAFTDSSSVEAIGDKSLSNRFIGSVQAEWQPLKGLSGRMTLGIDEDDLRQDQSFPLDASFGVSQLDQGDRAIFTRKSTLYTYTFDTRYSFTPLQNLNLSAVVGTQIFDRRFNTFFAEKFNFLTGLITNIGAGSQLDNVDETFSHRREAGIFGEANLAYNDQYFLTLGIRRDYASVIGRSSPNINYPKVSAALRLDKYDWFPSVFGLMKARAAYGETGILPGLLDGIPLLYSAEPGGVGTGGVLSTIGNDRVKPERVKEIEFGIDTEFLRNYSLEFTYYYQKAIDSIIDFRNSPSTGRTASAVPFNIGETKGWGIETLLQASLFKSRNTGLDLTLINNYQDNEVKNLGGAQPIFDGFDVNVIKEGLSKHEYYTRPVLGATFNDDGTYAGPNVGADRVALGNPVPNYTGSFSLNLRLFKNLNIYALADWATSLSVFNATNVFAYRFGNNPTFNKLATQLGMAGSGVARFSSPVDGVSALTPGTAEYNAAAEEFSRLDWRWDANFIEDADFIKLRELSVSYSLRDLLPKLQGGNHFLTDLVIAFSATNLWTSTNYSGADPEINFAGARSLSRGIDFLTLQQPRTYNLSFRFSL